MLSHLLQSAEYMVFGFSSISSTLYFSKSSSNSSSRPTFRSGISSPRLSTLAASSGVPTLELPALPRRYRLNSSKTWVIAKKKAKTPNLDSVRRSVDGLVLPGLESGRGISVRPEFLQPLLVEVELHAEDEVGVLDHAVGDEEGHGGQSRQSVHFADRDEYQRQAGDDEQRVDRDLVRASLHRTKKRNINS